MVNLRPTKKLQSFLPVAGSDQEGDHTALGDWYVTRLTVDRKPLLLLISSRSLLPLITPAREIRSLPSRLADLVGGRLRRLNVPRSVIAAEQKAMESVVIGRTRDRSVVGSMVDFAKAVPFHLEPGLWNERTLEQVEDRLAETPCRASGPFDGVIFPDKRAPELLLSKWLANMPLQPDEQR
jgi:hypothetical protein